MSSVDSKLRQHRVPDVTRSLEYFSPSFQTGDTPLVLIPPPRKSCSCCLDIPSDAFVILQKWGKDVTPDDIEKEKDIKEVVVEAEDGLKEEKRRLFKEGFRCMCSWYNIAYLVTKQTATYNAKIRNVPTTDNVKVGISVTIVFRIFNARDFVYTLGARHFDELLRAAVEEGLRNLALDTSIYNLYELRGQAATVIIEDLNLKFHEFGVHFRECVITNVDMPDDLAKSLQQATLYGSKIELEQRHFEHSLSLLDHRGELDKRNLDIRNERLALQLEAKRKRAALDSEIVVLENEQMRELAVMRSEAVAHARERRARTNLLTGELYCEKDVVVSKSTKDAQCHTACIMADQEASSLQMRSEAEVHRMRTDAMAKKEIMVAEGAMTEVAVDKLTYELEESRLDGLRRLATEGRIIIAGETGRKFLSGILKSADIDELVRPV